MEGSASTPTQLGRYQILKKLTTGGMAELLLARTTGMQSFERHAVIKRIHPSLARDERLVKMFLDEARLAASLHHQNIVQVYDVGEQDGEYFFAMEYVHGEDLRRLHAHAREHEQPIPIAILASIVTAAASGLHHAHEQRGPGREPLELVHRDVSLGNILVGYDGSVKLVDFGLARAALRSVKTRTGTLKGKASYMSPEQCMGKPIDRRSDVFALGIVLYELATGRRLFKAANDYLSMTAIVAGDIPAPSSHRPELPAELDEIILCALAKSPESRYPSAEAMRGALEEFTIHAGLRVSTKALADYMHDMFGEPLEPWRKDIRPGTARPELVADDSTSYDGIVEPPAAPETIMTPADRRSAPIALAHAIASGAQLPDFVDENATIATPPPEFYGAPDDPSSAPTVVGGPLVTGDDTTATGLESGQGITVSELVPTQLVLVDSEDLRPAVTGRPTTATGVDKPASIDDARTTVAQPTKSEPMYVGPPAPPRWLVLAQRYRLLVVASAAALVLAIALVIMLVTRSSHDAAAADAGVSPSDASGSAATKLPTRAVHPRQERRQP